jgi:hypothetical protein
VHSNTHDATEHVVEDTKVEIPHQVAREAAADGAALARGIAEEKPAIAREDEQSLSLHGASRRRSSGGVSSREAHPSVRESAHPSARGRRGRRRSSRGRCLRSFNSSRYMNDPGDHSTAGHDNDDTPVAVASPVEVLIDGHDGSMVPPHTSDVRSTVHDEFADNRMAQRTDIDDSLDYMKPSNYTPYFCALVAVVCTTLMVSSVVGQEVAPSSSCTYCHS